MGLAADGRLKDSLAESEARSLDRLAAGAGLEAVLEGLLRDVESLAQGDMLASILLLDAAGEHLLLGAAPSLPDAYNEAIHGVAIGPKVGSCGTAAYLGHPIYVIDIAQDPLWDDFRELALEHGLRACWSTPITDDVGKVLGTFAIYHRAPRSPTPGELDSIRMISGAVAAAIACSRARDD